MKKILLLEDEDVLGSLYRKNMKEAGYDVLWCRTTVETEEAAKTFEADVVLLDHAIRSEERSGMELLPIIRKLLPSANIIVLSNYSPSQLEQKNQEDIDVQYLLKIDTSPKTLVAFLENHFGK